VSTSDWIAIAGDSLVFAGLLVTLVIYLFQRNASIRREINSTLELLRAVRDGITPWGNLHFNTNYSGEVGRRRAEDDYRSVMGCWPPMNWRVPSEPLNALVQRPETGLQIEKSTIQAASIAMWKIGIFNQVVQQQTEFIALHMEEIRDEELPVKAREALARAAQRFSEMIHCDGIGDASWYSGLLAALQENIAHLEARLLRPRRILRRPSQPASS
jgi:hypothetical protein